MADRTIDILLNMQTKKPNTTNKDLAITQKALKDIETQANRTREKMQKLAGVGRQLAVTGGLIAAPFILAMKKYLEMAKEDDPLAKRFKVVSEKMTEFQTRLGRVVAEQIVPVIEKVIPYVDKAITFMEKNPGFVKAALGLAAGLVVAGSIMSTVATVASMLATVQGLAAGFLGANAAGLSAAALPSAAGIAAAIGPVLLAVLTNPLTWAIAGLVLIRPIMNYLLGTNQTWEDIANTGKQLLYIIGYGVDKVIKSIGGFFTQLGQSIMGALRSLGEWISNGFSNIGSSIASAIGSIIPGKAGGGMIGRGLFMGGEKGREFVMSNRTTRAAESAIGGQLTQDRLLQALGGNRRISYYDNRRIDSRLSPNDRRLIRNDAIQSMAGAI